VKRTLLLAGGLLALAALAMIPLGLASAKSSGTTFHTASGLKQARWQSNVAVSFSKSKVTYSSNGLPSTGYLSEYAVPNANQPGDPNPTNTHVSSSAVRGQPTTFTLTTNPKKLKKKTQTLGGAIGVMINGAVLFNAYEANNKTVAVASNFTIKDSQGNNVPFIDPCNGHPTPTGQYHYHALPPCVASLVDTSTGPSHIIGIALDGFPIYGDRDIKGRQISASKLDSCNGITSKTPEFPKGIYHYVLFNSTGANASMNCLHGKFTTATMRTLMSQRMYCTMPGMAAGHRTAQAGSKRGSR
jgi:hypothetical protein